MNVLSYNEYSTVKWNEWEMPQQSWNCLQSGDFECRMEVSQPVQTVGMSIVWIVHVTHGKDWRQVWLIQNSEFMCLNVFPKIPKMV